MQWKNEDDVLYDVVPNKHIIPSEGVDILDITVGSICDTLYHGKPFPAEVIGKGNFNNSCL